MKKIIQTFDTTLRDGMQSQSISFSVNDKLNIVHLLDSLGIDFIEAGIPYGNVTDREFFNILKNEKLNHSKPVVFGSTCHAGTKVEDSDNLNAMLETQIEYCAVVGKAWKLHITDVLKTTPEENLRMIDDSIRYLVGHGRKVIFDAEHFFDGFFDDKEYALNVIRTAALAGAETVVLCDTNGGVFPHDIQRVFSEVSFVPLGIHTHNDCGMAVANAVEAVRCGAVHVQGTLNGIGERCGNANLATLIANLQLKKNYSLIPAENMKRLTEISRAVAQISNISTTGFPYVSRTAFSHKAGLHIDAVMKNPTACEHIMPEEVGNTRNILVSEMSGKSTIYPIIKRFLPEIEKNSPETDAAVSAVKELEYKGFQFESAQASLELVIMKTLGIFKPHFDIERLKLITEQEPENAGDATSSALIKVNVGGKSEITATESDGPVHALDDALRKALYVFFPELENTKLTDYKVRVLDAQSATGATVRVFVETSDGSDSWTTVGVSVDVIEASKQALIDGIEYKLYKEDEKQCR